MHAHVMAERDPNVELVWRAAFADSEKPSGRERLVKEAAERDRQTRAAAKQSGAGFWLSSLRRRNG